MTTKTAIPPIAPLSDNQVRLLLEVNTQCTDAACTGGCTVGWGEPIDGSTLRSIRSLKGRDLVTIREERLTHGRLARSAHITRLGRRAAKETST